MTVRVPILAALAVLLALPGAASAGTVVVSAANQTLTITGSGDADSVTLHFASGPDRFELSAGAGTAFAVGDGCSGSQNVASCPDASVTSIVANLEGGDDKLILGDPSPTDPVNPLTATFGAGNDTLTTTRAYGCGGVGQFCFELWADPVDVAGGAGDDNLNGTFSADVLAGDAGADELKGGGGDDRLAGGDDNDALEGGAGNDVLTPGRGTDTLDGGDGTDTASYADRVPLPPPLFAPVDPVTVTLDGQANDGADGENDNAGPGIENAEGGAGGDTLVGDGGPNALSGGGGGGDVIRGLGGVDVLDGGDGGADTVDYSDATAPVRVDLAGGPGMGTATEPETLPATFERAIGGAGDDELTGNAGFNILVGGAGNDLLEGLDASDTLDAGAGNDRLDGGAGNDTLSAGEGADRLEGGAGADSMDAGNGADVLTGGPGGAGDGDAINGGVGRDLLGYDGRTEGVSVTLDASANDGGAGEADNVSADIEGLSGGRGPDTFTLTSKTSLRIPLAPVPLPPIGRAAQTGRVEAGRVVQGGDGNDTITGGTGNDLLSGGPGRDRVRGGAGNDSVNGGSGDDSVEGGEGNDRVLGALGNDVLVAGAGDDIVVAADTNGRDRADCGAGTDTLLRDSFDRQTADAQCEKAIGVTGFKLPSTLVGGPAQPGTGEEANYDPMGLGGDEPIDFDGDGIPDDSEGLPDGLGFDDAGFEFDDDFFGFDDGFGDFGDDGEIKQAIMAVPTKKAKVRRSGFTVAIACPKAAERRCIGEVAIVVTKGKRTRELVSKLFTAKKGKTLKLKLALRSRALKLLRRGKKGNEGRLVVEARDSGDLLFGIDQELTLRR